MNRNPKSDITNHIFLSGFAIPTMDHSNNFVELDLSKNSHHSDALFSLLPSREFLVPPPRSFEVPFHDTRYEPRPLGVSYAGKEDCPTSLTDLIGFAMNSALAGKDDSMAWKLPSCSKRAMDAPTTTYQASILSNKRFKLSDEEQVSRFSSHQDELWLEQFGKLNNYKQGYGHCCVPITYGADQMLARWVKRQRYQYKRYKDCKPSAINPSRIELLDSIGFIWDAHSAQWQEKMRELTAYACENGHCSIPSYDPNNVRLSTWVKCQRRQYKLRQSGKPSNMTDNRIEKLNSIGFAWSLRST